MSEHPRVFISYSHDSPEHSDRVLAFALALRKNGIDVELDQFHNEEIVDWPRWCNEQTSREFSDFVLCVCTPEYSRRIEGKVLPEKGKGVHWEGSLLDDDLYDEKGNSRLIPVLFGDESENAIPRLLRGWTRCNPHDFLITDSGFEHVVRILTKQASVVKNALGKIPNLPPKTMPFTGPESTGRAIVAPTRLPHWAEELFGREDELAAIEGAWDDPQTHVMTIVAWGGTGKTSLVGKWMADKAAADWAGFERVYDWPFYSQGTSEKSQASADLFVKDALTFFGDKAMAESAASAWEKGAQLARLVGEHRSLLVLDGLEPLQYPPGPMGGRLKDPTIEALIKGLAQKNRGLCVVTTRERVANLEPFHGSTVVEWKLEHLSTSAGVELLKKIGVKGALDELRQLVEEMKGHALTLSLIGRYLVQACGGDIRQRELVTIEEADEEVEGGRAFRGVMRAYEKWFESDGVKGKELLAILRLLGFFDRPASRGCLSALRKPVIAGLNEPLLALNQRQWQFALTRLAGCGLVSDVSDVSKPIDAHPLVREYYAKQLREENPDGYQAGHRRLYEYLKETPDKATPTLEDLQPLYQAVAHGCQAGLHRQACADIYRDRILRGHEGYSTRKLGAIGADLGAVACLFIEPWTRLAPGLSEPWRAWLLNDAAYSLRALGRLTEALEPMRSGLEMFIKQEKWTNASINVSNLSELELTLGLVADAVRDAEESVVYADRSDDAFQRMAMRTALADALHQTGRLGEALALFLESEAMQAKRQAEYPQLYSLGGFRYCDLLLGEVERAAWSVTLSRHLHAELPSVVRPGCMDANRDIGVPGGTDAGKMGVPLTRLAETLALPLREVEGRAGWTIEWAKQAHGVSLLDVALDHLTLGRVGLYRGLLEASRLTRAEAFDLTRYELGVAVDGLRRAGTAHHIPRGLLSRAWLRFVEGNEVGAREDLDEAWEIAERGPMKLHMADVCLYRARFLGDREALAQARALIEECGYHRRDEQLAFVEKMLE